MLQKYAEIILPIVGPCYTFSIPAELSDSIEVGCAVSVQFGVRKITTGIVRTIHTERPPFKKIKPVLEVLFSEPVVGNGQLHLWEWIAEYYMCTLGEVMRAAVPALLKASGFSAEEFAREAFRPRTTTFIELSAQIDTEAALGELCENLRRRAPKQYDALVEVADKLGARVFGGSLDRRALTADIAILNALRKKGIVTFVEREISADNEPPADFCLPTLTSPQQKALDELCETFRDHRTSLLLGVPSAGKSEVSFHAIASTLASGRDVLMLVPEISLSTQFVRRVRAVFGERVVLYHSALSARRRAEAYLKLTRAKGGSLVVGVRSAVLLPLKNLGLVVVDEEQDPSYKQQDPAPRYNARDVAVMLGQIHGASVILSSATPSLETWTNSQGGKYGLTRLTERYGDAPPPEIIISDTLRAVKRGERKSHFNKELLERLHTVVGRGEQAILFQNRRGIAPYLECADCGWVPQCTHCGIPTTVHRSTLRCHYCGISESLPSVCPVCGSMKLEARGFGTEKIEEELARLIPSARILRLDRDSAGSEDAYNRIISEFEAGGADILVGTQMVTKGLDFAGVSLVGILNADNLLNHPDFRASERAYQLIAQVAGRSGRRDRQGEVVIQTASPSNSIINQAAVGDYEAMAADILPERKMYGYPPYGHLVTVVLRHADRNVLGEGARVFADLLRPTFDDRLLGPQPSTVERIKGEWALVCMVKVSRQVAMSRVREVLSGAMKTLAADPRFRKITVTTNIDPQ
jgi:primosomal protein N' (replication factor Y)